LNFGSASAEDEGASYPDLLLKGFYDVDGITEEAATGTRFLVLGYKGSGKSAVGERLRLLSVHSESLFVRSVVLGDFPFSKFSRIVSSNEPTEAESNYPGVWKWLLLLQLLQSLSEDSGAKDVPELNKAISGLKRAGLLPSDSLQHLVLQSVKTGITAKALEYLNLAMEREYKPSELGILDYVEYLLGLLKHWQTPNRHILVIDGLDDILSLKNLQYQILAALVLAAQRLNAFFQQNTLPVKIAIMCRTDLFTRLPGPNTNKLRQDSAIELNWYHDPSEPGQSKLVALANHRANVSDSRVSDLFDSFLPRTIGKRPIHAFLADHTRHTPRDFLRLLAFIQKCSHDKGVDADSVLKGIRDYSGGYFLPELKNELVGVASPAQADNMFGLLGALRRREFTLHDLKLAAEREVFDVDVNQMVRVLFDCSAIGNKQTDHYWFKYRNPYSTVNLEERFVLHPGLWRAFNLV